MADEAAPASPAGASAQDESVQTAPETDVVETLVPVSDATPGSSPEAKDENKPASMLDALKEAIKPKDAAAESSVAETSPEKASEPAAEKPAGEEDFTDADMPQKGTKAFRRIKQLTAETSRLKAEVEQHKTDAETYRRVVSFIENAGLATDEVNQGFEIMRLMKADPFAAMQALLPYVQQLQQVTGQVLPERLTQEVRQGYLTEQHARQIAELEARNALREQQARQALEAAERQRQQQVMQERGQRMQSAVQGLEAQWSASDPDYAAKRGRVFEKVQLALYEAQQRGTYPQTEQEAAQIALAAKKAVDDEIRALMPQRRPLTPAPAATATVAARPAPNSMLEAMQMALRA